MKRWIEACIAGVSLFVITSEGAMRFLLGVLFQKSDELLYPLSPPIELFFQHAELAVGASLIAAVIGFVAGTAANYNRGSFRNLVLEAGAFAQTVPPVAVLALLVPVLGFGTAPVLVALILYENLPVIHGTLSGLSSVPPNVLDAAKGLGMGRTTQFFKIELPLALPALAAGIRTSVVINVGTAAIGATMGAGGFGRPIMAGLVQFKTSYIIQGAVSAAVMALVLDWFLSTVERSLDI